MWKGCRREIDGVEVSVVSGQGAAFGHADG